MEVIRPHSYQWVVNEEHARLVGRDPGRVVGGERVTLGQVGPVFEGEPPVYEDLPWGLDLIAYYPNGQTVTFKQRAKKLKAWRAIQELRHSESA